MEISDGDSAFYDIDFEDSLWKNLNTSKNELRTATRAKSKAEQKVRQLKDDITEEKEDNVIAQKINRYYESKIRRHIEDKQCLSDRIVRLEADLQEANGAKNSKDNRIQLLQKDLLKNIERLQENYRFWNSVASNLKSDLWFAQDKLVKQEQAHQQVKEDLLNQCNQLKIDNEELDNDLQNARRACKEKRVKLEDAPETDKKQLEVIQVLETDLKEAQSQLQEQKTYNKFLNDKVWSFKRSEDNLKNDLESARKEFHRENGDLAQSKNQLAKDKETLQKNLDEKDGVIAKLKRIVKRQRKDLKASRKLNSKISREKEISDLKADLLQSRHEVEELKKQLANHD